MELFIYITVSTVQNFKINVYNQKRDRIKKYLRLMNFKHDYTVSPIFYVIFLLALFYRVY